MFLVCFNRIEQQANENLRNRPILTGNENIEFRLFSRQRLKRLLLKEKVQLLRLIVEADNLGHLAMRLKIEIIYQINHTIFKEQRIIRSVLFQDDA